MNLHTMNTISADKNPLFAVGVLLFIGVVACFILYDISEDYRKQIYAHEHFQPVEAKVLESEVKTRSSSAGSSNRRTTWHPYIYYRFEIDGKGYRSKVYSYAYKFNNSKSKAEEIVRNHPVGARVMAYYNPEKPVKAVLDKSKPDITWLVIFFSFFGIVYLFIVGVLVRQILSARKGKVDAKFDSASDINEE